MSTDEQKFEPVQGRYTVEDPANPGEPLGVLKTFALAKIVALAASHYADLEGRPVHVYDPLGQLFASALDGEWVEAEAVQ